MIFKVKIHRHPDLDAYVAEYILRRALDRLSTVFVDTIWVNIHPDVAIDCHDDYAVWEFDHHTAKTAHFDCAADAVLAFVRAHEDWPADWDFAASKLAQMARLADNREKPPEEFAPGYIGTLLRGIKIKIGDEADIAEAVEQILDYIWTALIDEFRRRTREITGEFTRISVNGYNIVATEGNITFTDRLFGKFRADIVVIKDGYNILALRNAHMKWVDLRGMKPLLAKRIGPRVEEFFFHPRGFIVARGTKKYPAQSEPPLTLAEFTNIVKEFAATLPQKPIEEYWK